MRSQRRGDTFIHRESLIYLCRHGETEWSLEERHTSFTDIGLTPEGVKQAASLQKYFDNIQLDTIYSSPMKRARESSDLLIPTIEPLCDEWNYGEYEGLTTWQIHQKNADWNLFTDGCPGGESPRDVEKRADLLLGKIGQKQVAIFSHAHFLRVFAARFLGLDAEDGHLFHLSPGSLSILGYEHGSPVIRLWNNQF